MILVADNVSSFCDGVQLRLQIGGYTDVQAVTNATEAQGLIESQEVRLLITWMNPFGVRVARFALEHGIPIIIVTGDWKRLPDDLARFGLCDDSEALLPLVHERLKTGD